MKVLLNGTLGKVSVVEAREDGTLLIEVKPAETFELSSSKKTYSAAFASDSVVVGSEKMTVMVQYYLPIPKVARSSDAATTKASPFRHKAAA